MSRTVRMRRGVPPHKLAAHADLRGAGPSGLPDALFRNYPYGGEGRKRMVKDRSDRMRRISDDAAARLAKDDPEGDVPTGAPEIRAVRGFR